MSVVKIKGCKCLSHNPRTMVCPYDVKSPQNRFVSMEEVIVNNGPQGFSLARIMWDDAADGKVEKVLAMRWNGYLESDGHLNKGHPVTRGYPTWFIVPVELEEALLSHKDYLVNIPQRLDMVVVNK
ncbi:hypothetical protein N7922_13945 [Kosakonia sp. ML.JS2a]|uniref:hypothetical protein n=1 Tax=Kosakonia sp. ML.JS2a TaxID=2980557 RepID=UPI0021DB7827|nr:hypothetical protein [Kosakonia sp. ML.JS2a]UXY08994.1 hypothetical protein N7922_13945 [Kosakonia sp. ML.JS2a]